MKHIIFKALSYPVFMLISVHSIQENYKRDKEKALSLVKQWAPKIWLYPEERFFPANVTDYLKEITPTKINCINCAHPTTELPVGPVSLDYFLITTRNRDELLKDDSSILYGSNPAYMNVSVYAFVISCDNSYNHFYITYWFFYPYNEGKEVCTMKLGKSKALPVLKFFKKCLGKTRRFGNHIADWEHMSLEIKNSTPSSMFLSVHNVGVYYTYDQLSHSFIVSSVKTIGLSEAQDPPSTVQVIDDHPILFSAKGSHGLWGSVGSYKFTKLKLNQLVDVVDYGTAWETWRSLQVFFCNETTPDWYNFWGRWGNPGSDCLARSDVCHFSNGPGGLSLRQTDFNCAINQNYFQ